MKKKNYAHLARRIFGPGILCGDGEIAGDQALADAANRIIEETWATLALERVAVEMMLEGKGEDEFAAYIRANADGIAKGYTARALRHLRQPKQAGKLRPYISVSET